VVNESTNRFNGLVEKDQGSNQSPQTVLRDGFLRRVFAHNEITSDSLVGRMWMVPKLMLKSMSKQVGLKVAGTDLEVETQIFE
jgi:hypothetical protein